MHGYVAFVMFTSCIYSLVIHPLIESEITSTSEQFIIIITNHLSQVHVHNFVPKSDN